MSDSVTKPSGSGRSSTTTCADISLPENLLIRRSARRKRIGIKLASDGTVELLAPANADEQLLKQAWDHFQPWLRKKQCELQQLPAMFKPRKFEFAIGEKFFFCGTEYELRLQEKSSSRLITLRDGYLWSPTEDPAEIKKMLEAFYRRQTRRLAAGKLERYAREFNIRIGEISINGARKRFG
jgi:predicted metal-dependent hydrolase